MFRRKEEGLFDSDVNEQTQDEVAGEEKAAAASVSAPASFGVSAAPVSASPSAVRAGNVPTASSFRPASAAPVASAPVAPATVAAPAADLTRGRLPEVKTATGTAFSASTSSSSSAGKSVKRVLTVGNDILLKGEIATCDRLVIEGQVDATLNDVHTVEIAECGSFKGAAQIEDAEISGLFEGDLVVRGRLVIYSTGKVRGNISYGEIEIERGGELTGEIRMTGAGASAGVRPNARANKDDKVAA